MASLDSKISEDGDATIGDMIITESLNDVNKIIRSKDIENSIKRAFESRLTRREIDILTMNYGLFGESENTLEEVGKAFELTRERVRQIVGKSIKKLSVGSLAREMMQYV